MDVEMEQPVRLTSELPNGLRVEEPPIQRSGVPAETFHVQNQFKTHPFQLLRAEYLVLLLASKSGFMTNSVLASSSSSKDLLRSSQTFQLQSIRVGSQLHAFASRVTTLCESHSPRPMGRLDLALHTADPWHGGSLP